jgi:glyoxylase-like metal-dependent hydrolase (beta-lactamase superfamily II)
MPGFTGREGIMRLNLITCFGTMMAHLGKGTLWKPAPTEKITDHLYAIVEITRPIRMVADGDVIEAGTIRVKVIATPGHTPGHVSYLIDGEVLCTGDTLNLENAKVKLFYKFWNMDHETDIRSVLKLAELRDISVLCTAHTGWTRNWDNAVSQWRQEK